MTIIKKNILFLSILFLFTSLIAAHAQVDTVINRYRDYLLRTVHVQPNQITHWVETISSNGQWPDINYKDETRADWQLWAHLKRLDTLSIVWSDQASIYYHDDAIWRVINLALNNWLKHKYQNPNWWHNQIGIPQCMQDIIILLRDTLSPLQLQQALEVMDQLHVQKNGAGANLIWSADLGFHYGALTDDTSMMDDCQQLLLNEIHISTGDGLQPDYSFHQHNSRLQTYQYGKAFLITNIRLAWELQNTRWAFPRNKINLLTNFLLNCWQWMARGINTVPGTMDRSVSRVGELRSPDIRYLLPFLRELAPEKTKAFKILTTHQNGEGSLVGFRHFPYSDFVAYQNKNFSFFLKTISTRTLPAEVGLNREDLKGRLANSGAAYLIRDGNEYYNMMPVWKWQKLPGITAFKDAYKVKRMPFVGSVSDGKSGLTAMDYTMENKSGKEKITAHKIWVCHKNMVICLLEDLNAENIKSKVYTVLDQCRLQGKVIVNNPDNVIKKGIRKLKNVRWIYHNCFAYIPLKPSTIELKTGKVTGTWFSINASESDSLITDSVFMPVVLQNENVHNISTGYVLAYCKDARDAMRISEKPKWKILQNDKDCQAVRFKDGAVMAAFFSTGKLKINNKNTLAVDRPCLMLLDNRALYVSNPNHQEETINIHINNQLVKIELNEGGTTSKVSLK